MSKSKGLQLKNRLLDLGLVMIVFCLVFPFLLFIWSAAFDWADECKARGYERQQAIVEQMKTKKQDYDRYFICPYCKSTLRIDMSLSFEEMPHE